MMTDVPIEFVKNVEDKKQISRQHFDEIFL